MTRLLLDAKGRVKRICEHNDASEEERRIGLCNATIGIGANNLISSGIDRLAMMPGIYPFAVDPIQRGCCGTHVACLPRC